MSRTIFLVVALLAGALLPIQAALNSKMGKSINNPIAAAFISFAVGTLALFFYLLITRQAFHFSTAYKQAPWYAWFAGILGTFYVVASIIILPRLGVALAFSLVVFGQLLISLLMDHFGLLGVEIRTINFYRILGVLFLIAGVILIRKF
ncbi:MAG: DMT family transporter [Ginsengibacter sp.]